jgi:hypothetical protein
MKENRNDSTRESRWISQKTWNEKYPHDCPWKIPDECNFSGGYREFTLRECFLETIESIRQNAAAGADVGDADQLLFAALLREIEERYESDQDQDIEDLYLEAKFRNRYLNYRIITRFPIGSEYVNGVSLEMMGTTPEFCREWCRDHSEYAPIEE